jgi:hypothetical protein
MSEMNLCPACDAERMDGAAPDRHLCDPCWERLPAETQAALLRREGAGRRYNALLTAIKAGRRLEEIALA